MSTTAIIITISLIQMGYQSLTSLLSSIATAKLQKIRDKHTKIINKLSAELAANSNLREKLATQLSQHEYVAAQNTLGRAPFGEKILQEIKTNAETTAQLNQQIRDAEDEADRLNADYKNAVDEQTEAEDGSGWIGNSLIGNAVAINKFNNYEKENNFDEQLS